MVRFRQMRSTYFDFSCEAKIAYQKPILRRLRYAFRLSGWIEGVIQAQAYIKAGMAKKCLVIGAETLSRVVDIHDRDSMIYSDGAGATVIEATEEEGELSVTLQPLMQQMRLTIYFSKFI